MKFTDFPYQRPELDSFVKKFEILLEGFENADSLESQNDFFEKINEMREDFSSMNSLCRIRHSINTRDEFYEKENTFFDENSPKYEALNNRFYQLIVNSKFRKSLEKKWGSQLFVIADLSLKTFQPTILEDLQKENKLISNYNKIKAIAEIEFEGKKYNLSTIIPLENSKSRPSRKAAAEAKWTFYEKNSEAFEQIYDQQVKVRHEIAQKLGYKNFIELGYARMLRSDYNAEMVANFRKQILEHVVPVATKLYERQKNRLGLESLKYYDVGFRFASGNPKPQGSPDWILNHASKMYTDLSPETKEFFNFMRDNELMDLVNKEGKSTGGYCSFIGKYKAPYIFSNFNGTSGDIDVLTHEAGHAFQVYSSRNIGLDEYNWPTYEACEIHSMSMEFFTYPWMDLFFEHETDKYKFAHLASAIKFLPYGVAVDEFQHFVYENPTITSKERNEAWRKIERKYLPHIDYGDNLFLKNGGFWQKQSHIFSSPFYYIDYTLAQVCAFQFWKKDQENHTSAWNDYINLCQAGGSQSFLNLVKLANLMSPFQEDCVKSVIGTIKSWLDSVDDSKF
ncbi:MAG: M3 family oligoendopeptidase [Saprospiraceae bacterium]|nr:M3 family oligoendopeptidase [Saprospiraceae bacterium]MDG2418964.1 M3 family oligoendopeptidase [Saprospiraceae bacterium]